MKAKRTAVQAGPRGRRERRALSEEFKVERVWLAAERRAARGPLKRMGQELDVRPDKLHA